MCFSADLSQDWSLQAVEYYRNMHRDVQVHLHTETRGPPGSRRPPIPSRLYGGALGPTWGPLRPKKGSPVGGS